MQVRVNVALGKRGSHEHRVQLRCGMSTSTRRRACLMPAARCHQLSNHTNCIWLPQHMPHCDYKYLPFWYFLQYVEYLIAGVQKIMVTGTSVRNSKEALRLTRLYPGTIYSTAGELIHYLSLTVAFVSIMFM